MSASAFHLHVVELGTSCTTPERRPRWPWRLSWPCAQEFSPVQSQLVVLGSMSLGGNIIPVEKLAETLQVAFDAGGKRLLLPMSSVGDIPSVPGELFAKFQTGFYSDPRDAAFKALGVE